MPLIERVLRLIVRLNGIVATLLFAALTVVVSLQIFTRFVLHAPAIWSEEVARFLFFWTVLTGAALSVWHRRHFVIDALPTSKGNGSPRNILAVIWHIIPALTISGFCLFLLVEGIGYTEIGTFRTGTNSRVNISIVYAAIPTFAALSLMYGIFHLINDIRRARRGDTLPSAKPPTD